VPYSCHTVIQLGLLFSLLLFTHHFSLFTRYFAFSLKKNNYLPMSLICPWSWFYLCLPPSNNKKNTFHSLSLSLLFPFLLSPSFYPSTCPYGGWVHPPRFMFGGRYTSTIGMAPLRWLFVPYEAKVRKSTKTKFKKILQFAYLIKLYTNYLIAVVRVFIPYVSFSQVEPLHRLIFSSRSVLESLWKLSRNKESYIRVHTYVRLFARKCVCLGGGER